MTIYSGNEKPGKDVNKCEAKFQFGFCVHSTDSNNLKKHTYLMNVKSFSVSPIEQIKKLKSSIEKRNKSDENIKSKSLSIYRTTFKPEFSIRYSLRNLKSEAGFVNVPLFMADYTLKILELIQEC